MKKFYLAILTVAIVMLLGSSSTVQAAITLTDPGFEAGAGWTTSGTYWNNIGWGGRTQDGSMLGTGAGAGEAYQEINVLGGELYEFSIFGRTDGGPTTGHYLRLAWYQNSTPLTPNTKAVTLPNTWTWAGVSAQQINALAPISANKVRVTFGSASSTGTYWDDATVVPEPTSLLLLGSGLIGLLGLRKRTKK